MATSRSRMFAAPGLFSICSPYTLAIPVTLISFDGSQVQPIVIEKLLHLRVLFQDGGDLDGRRIAIHRPRRSAGLCCPTSGSLWVAAARRALMSPGCPPHDDAGERVSAFADFATQFSKRVFSLQGVPLPPQTRYPGTCRSANGRPGAKARRDRLPV